MGRVWAGVGEGIAGLSLSLPLFGWIVALTGLFFFLHYLFATASGHATALLPVFLLVAQRAPGFSSRGWALALAYTLGLMGILTPYATGPSPIYYSSGYIGKRDFWTFSPSIFSFSFASSASFPVGLEVAACSCTWSILDKPFSVRIEDERFRASKRAFANSR